MCGKTSRPIVLMIDEVDSASNNRVFIDFLAQLRSCYLMRTVRGTLAAEFDINMNFSAKQIVDMLMEYEADHHTGMDVHVVAEEIYCYTSGYPVLVSMICKQIDEKIAVSDRFESPAAVWTSEGISEAVKQLLDASVPPFGNMMRHISEYAELKKMLYVMLFQGERISYNPDNRIIGLALMSGYVCNDNGAVRVAMNTTSAARSSFRIILTIFTRIRATC